MPILGAPRCIEFVTGYGRAYGRGWVGPGFLISLMRARDPCLTPFSPQLPRSIAVPTERCMGATLIIVTGSNYPGHTSSLRPARRPRRSCTGHKYAPDR